MKGHIEGKYKCMVCRIGFNTVDEVAKHEGKKHDGDLSKYKIRDKGERRNMVER